MQDSDQSPWEQAVESGTTRPESPNFLINAAKFVVDKTVDGGKVVVDGTVYGGKKVIHYVNPMNWFKVSFLSLSLSLCLSLTLKVSH